MTDLNERLKGIFAGELEDQLVVMNSDILALESNPRDAERLKSLFRVAHTLKGAAASIGADAVAETCHGLETLLSRVRDHGLALGSNEFTILFAAADSLLAAGKKLGGGSVEPTTDPQANVPALQNGAREYVRTDPEALDDVLASVEQILIAIENVDLHAGQARALGDAASTLATRHSKSAGRAHNAVNSGTPLDLAAELRLLSEQAACGSTDAVLDARSLKQAGNALASRVRRLRLRPFSEACEALPRLARDLSAATGKNVSVTIAGGDVRADIVVLDGLREAIVHLVRNAVDHGIEPSAARLSAGKTSQAHVTVSARVVGDSIRVSVEDDGGGLDIPAIRKKLESLGRIVPADDRAVAAALFTGGVTTRAEATTISGRGVGLDLVRDAVARIHGTVEVDWTIGRGAVFTLQSPLTLATARVLTVRVGTETIALPTANVVRVRRIGSQDLRRSEGSDVLIGGRGEDGAPLRVATLAALLGPPLLDRPLERNGYGVILEAQGRRLAVIVDELVAEQDVIVRKLDSVRARVPYLSGLAILAGGRIALVAHVAALISKAFDSTALRSVVPTRSSAPARIRRVLVVDDSITTRMLEQSVLEAAGYEVSTAVDGVNALERLAESDWDLVVSDVEMPRMDGFGLCEAIRRSSRLADTPVVLVTALENSEHRARGLEAGASAYLGKSSFDQRSLLDTVQRLFE